MKVLYHGSTHFRKSGGREARGAAFCACFAVFGVVWYMIRMENARGQLCDPGV